MRVYYECEYICVFVTACVQVHVCKCLCALACVRLCVCAYVHACVYECVHVCVGAWTGVYMCVGLGMCGCVCLWVQVFLYDHVYSYTVRMLVKTLSSRHFRAQNKTVDVLKCVFWCVRECFCMYVCYLCCVFTFAEIACMFVHVLNVGYIYVLFAHVHARTRAHMLVYTCGYLCKSVCVRVCVRWGLSRSLCLRGICEHSARSFCI